MAVDIKCKLIEKLQVESGNSARGPWRKQNFIVETVETYPRKICMNVWGDDKVSELQVYAVGEVLNISVNIESREFNGRWYTDVRAWRIQRDMPAGTPVQDPGMGAGYGSGRGSSDPFIGAGADGEGDLPF